MHILIVEALLVAIGKDAYMYIRPTLMPDAVLRGQSRASHRGIL
jgi:hypothetical protein